MTEQVKLSLISGIVQVIGTAGTVVIAYFARKFGSQLKDIHRNTNSLVTALVEQAEKKGDKAGYERGRKEIQKKEKGKS